MCIRDSLKNPTESYSYSAKESWILLRSCRIPLNPTQIKPNSTESYSDTTESGWILLRSCQIPLNPTKNEEKNFQHVFCSVFSFLLTFIYFTYLSTCFLLVFFLLVHLYIFTYLSTNFLLSFFLLVDLYVSPTFQQNPFF